MSFPALFAGRCSRCKTPYAQGTELEFQHDERKAYLVIVGCEGCKAKLKPKKTERIYEPCAKCFQIPAANGVCGCSE